jgi:cysteine desulfurase
MLPYFTHAYSATRGSVHSPGPEPALAVDECARIRGVVDWREAAEIVFTSGGTEADNLAIFGVSPRRTKRKHVITTSAIEHHAVLHSMRGSCKRMANRCHISAGEPRAGFGRHR